MSDLGLLSAFSSAWIPLIVGAVLFALIALELIVILKLHARYVWSFHGKEICAELRMGSAKLYVGGALEDEISGVRARVCMLRAFVDGTEVLLRVRFGFRLRAEATANGVPLTPLISG